MNSRRDFLKKASLLSGLGGVAGMLPPSIQRAFAIDPPQGTTWLDAAHVVILMQENRSFDHCFGTLRGVRGFGDPRAINLPDQKPVFFQTNEKGETYAPFRLNIKDTKATWMGSLPHGWTDQVDARNGGKYDQWLVAKRPGRKEYSEMPLTLGYYNREDLPFYYSLADAFTICDQNFCSSLTGTTANRLYLWTGKIREDNAAPPRVRNEETDYDAEAQWMTFPERLSRHGVTWKIYQNELSAGNGFDGEHDAWLANFTDNPIEWFSQYHVRFHPMYLQTLPKRIAELEKGLAEGEEKIRTATGKEADQLKARIARGQKMLTTLKAELVELKGAGFENLAPLEKEIHQRAFTTNTGDPDYHQLTTLSYQDGDVARAMKVPKGDVLYQFREDVKNGSLPAVSWLVAPENFSDHPGAPWYGAWYLSEAMDILTQNPEVWRKTIFILCYDENDGYFDHVPPFVPPQPGRPETGKASASIDLETEFVRREHELKRKPPESARESVIGLGYRVPLVVASPWSRGGAVCSQVFDHTSILMFLEKFVSHKTGKEIKENNISAWRRTVCGDLTAVFKPYNGEKYELPVPVVKEEFFERINQAQFKSLPATPGPLRGGNLDTVPRQEKGTRPSCAIPYELYAHGSMVESGRFQITFKAGKDHFGSRAAGSPFQLYSLVPGFDVRSYAVSAGDEVKDVFNVDGGYHLKVYGPNGFFRSYRGGSGNDVEVMLTYRKMGRKPDGNVEVTVINRMNQPANVVLSDQAYGHGVQRKKVGPKSKTVFALDLKNSANWYDLLLTVEDLQGFEVRLAGHVETGDASTSDPAIGA